MSADEILAIRDKSQGWNSAMKYGKTADSPWKMHQDRMWSKTAVRRLANSGEMPMSVEFIMALEADDARADYGAFAVDPNAGLVIDGTAETENDNPPEVTKDVEKPTGRKARTALPQENKPAADPRSELREGETIDGRTGEILNRSVDRPAAIDEAERKYREAPAAAVDLSMFKNIYDAIVGDLIDGAEVEHVWETYDQQVIAMRAAAPALFKNLMDEFEGYVTGSSQHYTAGDDAE
jgi:recombination protein RecT